MKRFAAGGPAIYARTTALPGGPIRRCGHRGGKGGGTVGKLGPERLGPVRCARDSPAVRTEVIRYRGLDELRCHSPLPSSAKFGEAGMGEVYRNRRTKPVRIGGNMKSLILLLMILHGRTASA